MSGYMLLLCDMSPPIRSAIPPLKSTVDCGFVRENTSDPAPTPRLHRQERYMQTGLSALPGPRLIHHGPEMDSALPPLNPLVLAWA